MFEWWQICIFIVSCIFILFSLGSWFFDEINYRSESAFWVHVLLMVLAFYAAFKYWPK